MQKDVQKKVQNNNNSTCGCVLMAVLQVFGAGQQVPASECDPLGPSSGDGLFGQGVCPEGVGLGLGLQRTHVHALHFVMAFFQTVRIPSLVIYAFTHT